MWMPKPAHFSEGGIIRPEVVNTLDLYGTILDAADDTDWGQPQEDLEDLIEAGSLTPLLSGAEDVVWQDVVWQDAPWQNQTFSIIGPDPRENLVMLRRDNLKLIRLACGEGAPLYELYDLNDEIVAVQNVFDDPKYADQRDQLKTDLDLWWGEQCQKYPAEVKSYRV